jgi:hypothetical protein
LVVLVLLAGLVLAPAAAQAAAPTITVDAPTPMQVTVNGSPYLLTNSSAALQGTVCVPQYVYQDSFARYAFDAWFSSGKLVGSSTCLDVSSGGYLAHFIKQYAVSVTYSPQNTVASSTWVDSGSSVLLSVPVEMQSSSFMYKLNQVIVAGTPVYAPSGAFNVSASGPEAVQAIYNQFTNVTLVLPSGASTLWAPTGQSWYHVFASALPGAGGSSLRLDGFQVYGTASYAANGNTMSLTPSAPVVIVPSYALSYFVTVTDPTGVVLRGWFQDGSLVNATVPGQLPVNNEERLVFAGWAGMNGTNQISVPVNSTMNLTAEYSVEYQVTQSSPLGVTSEWVLGGKSTAVSFPTVLPASLGLTRTLTETLVNGVETPNQQGTVVVPVNGPVQVVGVYGYAPDYVFIGVIVVIAAVFLVGYFFKTGSQPKKT